MRIHTDHLTEADILVAASYGGVLVEHVSRHGSRSRHHAFEVALSGSSSYGGAFGNLDYAAATWDEWGIVLGVLFRSDETLIAGPYLDAEHFTWSTGDRYTPGFEVADQHKRHRWTPTGRALTGLYAVAECYGCGAVRRFCTKSDWPAISEQVLTACETAGV